MRKAFLWVVFLLISGVGFGSEPEVKNYQKQKELLNGSFDGISITWKGELQLAPRHDLIFNIERPFVWDVKSDKNGNLFVATGDGAKIYKIDKAGKHSEIVHWEKNEIYSLAVDGNNLLYAAVSQDGKIYRFKNNQPELFVSLGVKYIWDMVFDSNNTCFVATGDSGSIYQISPDGKKTIFYQGNEVHFRSLAWDKNGRLLAGSFNDGYIYRITKTGEAFVIYDSEFQEIHHLCVAQDGTIYAAGLGKEGVPLPVIARARQHQPMIVSGKPTSVDHDQLKPGIRQGVKLSGIIKISPSGIIKDIWNKNTDMVQSIYLQQDQSLLVGTSDKGRLYKIFADEERTLVLKLDGAQVVGFAPSTNSSTWVATSNLGKIYRVLPDYMNKGFYQSPVIDAKSTTRWGAIQWQSEQTSGCKINFYTRSGNTEKPNDTWSSWSSSTFRNHEMEIISPAARFLQWKIELVNGRKNMSPILRNVKISYLQENLPPDIIAINVSGSDEKKDNSGNASKSKGQELTSAQVSIQSNSEKLPDGKRTLQWKANDVNGDQLLFHLFFQQKEEKGWRTLKKSVTRNSYKWDSRMMPDGEFRIKIVASDEKSNPVNMCKKTEKISDWFVIDNSGPQIDKVKLNKVAGDSLHISFRVTDEFSPVNVVEFATNVQKWQLVYPNDFICDSKTEYFDFKIAGPAHGIYSVVVKATDSFNNIGFNRSIVKE